MTDEAKDDLKVEEQTDGTIVVEGLPPDESEVKEADERLKESSEELQDDEAGHEEETSEEAEARKQRNRERRAQNKANRQNYVESLKRELASRDKILDEVTARLAAVERNTTGNQVAQVDAALEEASRYYNHFKALNTKAIELADGQAAVDAQEKMFAARQRFEMLTNAKKQMTQRTQQAPPLDPRAAQLAQGWMDKNNWYDPTGTDQDSDLVLQIDKRLVNEGWNPTTTEYWQELDARTKKYLPHRVVSGYNNAQGDKKPPASAQSQQRVPVSGSGQESIGAPKGSYRLSPERVQAMKDAGIYEDSVKRNDMIRRYQAQDRAAAANK